MRTSLVVWLVFAVPHFVFHAATLHHYPLPVDRAVDVVGLGFVVPLPIFLLYLESLSRTAARRRTAGTQSG